MRIRAAEPGDSVALAHVLVATFRAAHRDQLPPDYPYLTPEQSAHNWERTLRAHRGERGERERIFAAEDDDGRIVGVAMAGPLRGEVPPATIADLYLLYVLPSQQRRGIGGQLLVAVARWAAERGYRALQVRVLDANAPARRFYEALGAHHIGDELRPEATLTLQLAVYEWPDLATFQADGAGSA